MSRHNSLGGADVTPVAGWRTDYEYLNSLNSLDLVRTVEWDTTGESLTYHGHCYQKTIKWDYHANGVLRQASYKVKLIDSRYYKMFNIFGYEAEHYSMGQAIGDILSNQITDSVGEIIVMPGGSC